jgi:uncharacterized protein DUF6171
MCSAILALFRGPVLVDEPTLHERRAICAACPSNDNGWCVRCTCYIPLKTQLSTEECPLDLWQKKLTRWQFLTHWINHVRSRLKFRL